MARLTAEWTAKVTLQDEQVILTFREPSNSELNRFLDARYETGRKGKIKDHSNKERCNFFDRLLVKVENLEDVDGTPITVESKEKLPANWKANIISNKYEDDEDIDLKN